MANPAPSDPSSAVVESSPSTRDASRELPATFSERRRRLMQRIGSEGAALFLASPTRRRSHDTHHDYRPSSDLWYLTGCEETEAAGLLLPEHGEHPFVMFVREKDPETEVWEGLRLGVDGAAQVLGADRVLPYSRLAEELPRLLLGRSLLVYGLGWEPAQDEIVLQAYAAARRLARSRIASPQSIVDPVGLVHEMRLIKSSEEIETIRRACAVTVKAHRRAMEVTRPGMTEYMLQAELEYVFMREGARAPGYGTIVGGGENACVLHYVANRDVLGERALVLVDAGAEIDWYTADLTRTWPVSGRFEPAQRALYDLVLRAQMDVLRLVRPGLPWNALHETAVRSLTEGLVDLGVLEGPVERAIEEKTYRPFFMHGVGHWLGMDVHDVGAYARGSEKGRPLEAGMVFTVEPGLYFPPGNPATPEAYRGIGIRIEDDVLVTEQGAEILTREAPKEPEELEEIVGTAAGSASR